MADIPFSWNIDLEISRFRTLYGSRDDPVLPYEPPSTVIKVSKFHLGTVLGSVWTLQFEHAKVYDQSFYGQEEKVTLLLQRDCSDGKVEIEGMIEVYDLNVRKRLAKTNLEYELDDRQKVVSLTLDISMSELSYAVFENTQLRIQGNITIIPLSDDVRQDTDLTTTEQSSSVETHIIKNNPLVELSYALSSLLEEGSYSDVTFKCDTTVLHGHMSIMSIRSPIFAAMFQTPMAESENNEWVVTDLELDVLKKMLVFVYCGQVKDLDFDMGCDLLFAADKYQLQGLAAICVEYLKSELTAGNALKVLTVGDLYDTGLKTFVLDYISPNFTYFKTTEEWNSLKDDNKSLAMEVYEHVMNMYGIVQFLNNKRTPHNYQE